MTLRKNQQAVYEIIRDNGPISKADIERIADQKNLGIDNMGKVLLSLKDNKHAIKQNSANAYSVNPSFVSTFSTIKHSISAKSVKAPAKKKKAPKINYSKMISSGNNGRFNKLKRQLNLEVKEKYVVLLNKNNSKKIEKVLREDLSYVKYTEMFCVHCGLKTDLTKRYDVKVITGAVRIIDIENGTQQWLNTKGRNRVSKMIAYIIDPNKKFWEDLDAGKPELVDNLIQAAVAGEGKNAQGKDFDGPKSLASKICKYLSLYVLKDKDDYYVNDRFVRKVLPYYFRYYLNNKRITGLSGMSYAELHKLFMELHQNQNIKKEKLTKHEIDHIMWYSYKNSKGAFVNKSKKPKDLFYYL